MPRVLPQVGTKPLPPAYRNVDNRPDDGLARGLERVGEVMSAIAEEEEKKANAVAVLNAENEFRRAWDDAENAVQLKHGEEAFAESTKTYERMDKLRGDLRTRLTNETQRNTFEIRSSGVHEAARSRVENYLGAQRRAAQQAAATDSVLLSLNDLSRLSVVLDEEQLGKALATPEAPIRTLSPSKAHAEAAVKDWRGKAFARALKTITDTGNMEAAERFYEVHKAELGAEADEYLKHRLKWQTEGEAIAIAAQIAPRDRLGRVDEAKALAAVDTLAPEKQDRVRALVHERIREGDALYKAEVQKRFAPAYTAYITGGLKSVPPELRNWLIANAPELYDRLRKDAEVRSRLSRSDAAEARRAQAQADRLAELDFRSRDSQEQAEIDPLTEYAGTPTENGLPPSAEALKRIQVVRKQALEKVERGDAVGEAEFVRAVVADANGMPLPANAIKSLRAEAAAAYDDLVREKKRKPNRQELDAISDSLLMKVTRERDFWFDTQEFEFQRRARERAQGGAGAAASRAAEARPAPPGKVAIIGPNGKRGFANAEGLDAWLAAHPGWRKE